MLHDVNGTERELIETGLTAWGGESPQPVYLLPNGRFIVLRDDAGDPLIRDSYAELTKYFDGVIDRAERKARETQNQKKSSIEVAVLLKQTGGYGGRIWSSPEYGAPHTQSRSVVSPWTIREC